MPQGVLTFQYTEEKSSSGMTALAGLREARPLLLAVARGSPP